MIQTEEFGRSLQQVGVKVLSGVPCSFLTGLINYANNDWTYVNSTSEGEAVAVAAGAILGGQQAAFLCQNSGLTNALSPLTSLVKTFNIPLLGFVTWRGAPSVSDEPQHELMGRITPQLLDLIEVESAVLQPEDWQAQLKQARQILQSGRSFIFIVPKDTFSSVELRSSSIPTVPPGVLADSGGLVDRPLRWKALVELSRMVDQDTLLLATTGHTARELYATSDGPRNFYVIGSMGCVSSVGLGVALAAPKKKVVCLDGDGSLLMRLGSLAMLGRVRPRNLLHIVFDNGVHLSTGGQATCSSNVSFPKVAQACGYPRSVSCASLAQFLAEVANWNSTGGLTFLSLPVQAQSKEALPRPSESPAELRERFMKFIAT